MEILIDNPLMSSKLWLIYSINLSLLLKRMWEDFQHGLIFGSKEYCDYIKSKYISKKKPDVEIPQKRLVLGKRGLNTTIRKVASILECCISSLISHKRLSGLDKDKLDILILLWNTGIMRLKKYLILVILPSANK